MNHLTLYRVAFKLYGERWPEKLSAEIGVNERTLRRWALGEMAIPDGVWGDLADVCEAKSDDLRAIAETLRNGEDL